MLINIIIYNIYKIKNILYLQFIIHLLNFKLILILMNIYNKMKYYYNLMNSIIVVVK